MRQLLLVLLLLPLNALAGSSVSEDAYQSARKSYYALKADPARRKFRHHWRNVAHRFEGVAAKYSRSARAPDALFSAAELLEELSKISMLDEDLRDAVADYQRLADAYPRSRLADDAALALGRIYAERLGQPDAARKALARGLEKAPRGDRAARMRALYASLEKASEKPQQASRKGAASSASKSAEEPAKVAESRRVSPKPATEEPAKVAESRPSKRSARPMIQVELATPAPERALGLNGKVVAVQEKAAEPEPADEPEEERKDPASVIATVDAATARERLKAARPRGGEITLAEQLGLKVRRVVIDAGHGGHDSGAIGPTGVQEKDVSLAIAKRLAEILNEAGLEVLLTRDDDSFVRLEDRARMANEARGDLFISVHCNSAANSKLRGVETYTLNTANDRYSIRLAARENSSSAKRISDLQFILADLATKANTEESQRLAARVQRSLTGQLAQKYSGVKDLGTKEALFYVLLGAKMPAILVETSFLSNKEDEQRLSSKEYQDEVAHSIASGVQDFLENRQRLATLN